MNDLRELSNVPAVEDSPDTVWMKSVAVLVGTAVPALVFGKLLIAVTLVPAFFISLFHVKTRETAKIAKQLVMSPTGLMLGLTALLWLPGVVFSLDPLLSFEAWLRTFLLVGAAIYLCCFLVLRPKSVDLALRTVLIMTLICCAIGFAGYAVPEFLGFIHAKGWTPLMISAGLKQFASVSMILCPIVILAGWRIGGQWRLLAGIDLIALIGIIMITSSRSSMAGLFATIVVVAGVMVRTYGNRKTGVLFLVALAIGLGAVIAWVYMQPMAPWARELDYDFPVWLIDPPRQRIWMFTIEKALESLWIGHGINVVNYLPGASDPIEGMGLHTFISGHPHNWAIEVWAETGLIGIISLLLLIAVATRFFVVRFRSTANPAFLFALAIHTAYWVSGLFNFSFWSVWWQASYLVLLALGGALALGQRPASGKILPEPKTPDDPSRVPQT
jgi:O-antigen ligase